MATETREQAKWEVEDKARRYDEAHDTLDTLGVPRHVEGSTYTHSVSARIELLVQRLRADTERKED